MRKRGTEYRWAVLGVAFFGVFGALGFGRFGYSAVLPSMQKALGLSSAAAGSLASWNLAGYTVMAAIGGRPTIYALNKTDLPRRFGSSFARKCPTRLVPVSCRTGAGIARLRSRLARIVRTGPGPKLMVNRRQLEALSSCRDALVRAGSAQTLETAALETRSAIDMLSQVDAPTTSTDILDRVFARFCVGK